MQSIYNISLNSAEGTPGFLEQFKGKASIIVNTTVGCGNANQMEVLQWLQEKYAGEDFQVIAIPTNDYCGPGITKGKWSQGITCGADSANYGKDVYGTTFQFSEMVASNPNENVSEENGKNGLGQENAPPHELYREIQKQISFINHTLTSQGVPLASDEHYSWWLNNRGGDTMGGNFEKYMIDKDGYVTRHFHSTVLNYDIEKTLRQTLQDSDIAFMMGLGRSKKIFEEEYAVVCKEIEDLIAGKKSALNPAYKQGE